MIPISTTIGETHADCQPVSILIACVAVFPLAILATGPEAQATIRRLGFTPRTFSSDAVSALTPTRRVAAAYPRRCFCTAGSCISAATCCTLEIEKTSKMR